MRHPLIGLALTFALSLGATSVAHAATTRFIATGGSDTTNDCSNVSTPCATFTHAILQATAGDTISAAAGTYNEGGILINTNLTVTGAGQEATIIDAAANASGESAILVDSGVTTAISNLTVENEALSDTCGGGINNISGGTVTLSQVTIRHNTAATNGGGVCNNGQMIIQNSLIGGDDNAVDGNKAIDSSVGGGIWNKGELALENTTVSANSTDVSASDRCAGNGGGIFNDVNATLTIQNSTISGNIANVGDNTCNNILVGNGGGIFNFVGKITIDHSVIEANQAANDTSLLPITGGGGIYNAGGDITIRNGSTINGNFAVAGDTTNPSSGTRGGGIFQTSGCNSSTPCPTPNLTVSNSTISNNVSFSDGGGIYRDNPMTLTNVTISGNTSVQGEAGGIYNNGASPIGCKLQSCPGTLINVTLANNKALTTGGISANNPIIPTILKNSLLAQNIQTSDNTNANCDPNDVALSSQKHNLSDDATCANFFTEVGDSNGQAAGIGPLADNGGNYPSTPFPLTHALLAGSKAIDAIPAVDCTDAANTPAPLTVDERNFPRPSGLNCDIGAFEFQVTPTPTPVPTSVPTPAPTLPPIPIPSAQPTPPVLPHFVEGSGSSCSLTISSAAPKDLPILAGLLFVPVLLRGLLRKERVSNKDIAK